jgi:hypothetical protein
MTVSGSRSGPVTVGTRVTTAPGAAVPVMAAKTMPRGAAPASRVAWKKPAAPEERADQGARHMLAEHGQAVDQM